MKYVNWASKEHWLPYALVLPALLIFTIFVFIPFFYTVYLSFFDWNMIKPVKNFVGWKNYLHILQDPLTWVILKNTAAYLGILLVFNCAAPYGLAFVLSFVIKRGQGFYKGAFFLPSVISLVVGSILYLWILNPVSGPAAVVAHYLGIVLPVWSITQGWVIVVLSLITTWKVFGYNFIVILGGVAGVPQEIIEAAKIDDVPLYRIFWDLVLPMSSATGVYILIMTIVQGLQYVFAPIKVITQGGPDNGSSNIVYAVYQEAFVLYHTGPAAALSILSMGLFLLLFFLEFKYVEKGVYYEH
jgi:sn-glycerol 3-phosphate transport system permease protein